MPHAIHSMLCLCACSKATQTSSCYFVVSVLLASHAACLGTSILAKFHRHYHSRKIGVQTAFKAPPSCRPELQFMRLTELLVCRHPYLQLEGVPACHWVLWIHVHIACCNLRAGLPPGCLWPLGDHVTGTPTVYTACTWCTVMYWYGPMLVQMHLWWLICTQQYVWCMLCSCHVWALTHNMYAMFISCHVKL